MLDELPGGRLKPSVSSCIIDQIGSSWGFASPGIPDLSPHTIPGMSNSLSLTQGGEIAVRSGGENILAMATS